MTSSFNQLPHEIKITEIKDGFNQGEVQVKFVTTQLNLDKIRLNGSFSPKNATYTIAHRCPDTDFYNEFVGNRGKEAFISEEDVLKIYHSKNNFKTKLKKSCPVYDKPDGKQIGELEANMTFPFTGIVEHGEGDDAKTFASFMYGRVDGYFDKHNRLIAEALAKSEDKNVISYLKGKGLTDIDKIYKGIKGMVNWPKDRETKEFVPVDEKRRPMVYVNCVWYKYKGEFGTKFAIPHRDKNVKQYLSKEQLCGIVEQEAYQKDPKNYHTKGLTFESKPKLFINGVYLGKHLTPQWKISGGVVTAMFPVGDLAERELADDLESARNDEEGLNELQKQMEEMGMSFGGAPPKSVPSTKVDEKEAETGLMVPVESVTEFIEGDGEIEGIEGVGEL